MTGRDEITEVPIGLDIRRRRPMARSRRTELPEISPRRRSRGHRLHSPDNTFRDSTEDDGINKFRASAAGPSIYSTEANSTRQR